MIAQELKAISFLDENPQIHISTNPENRPDVYIYDDLRKKLIFEGGLWPDFNGSLVIDLVPEIKDAYTPVLPGEAAALQQNYIYLKFRDEDDGVGVYHYGTVNLFSIDARERMSDADELVVPENFILPVSYVQIDSIGMAYIATRNGMIDIKALCPAGNNEEGVFSFLRPIKSLNLLPGEKFRVVIVRDGDAVYSPYYSVTSRDMEQYLFYNRLGGWDNIAMSGRLSIVPEYEFGRGSKDGKGVQTSAAVTRKYKQNSGGLTRQSASALAQLLESPAIYHLVNGAWQKIVIDAADITIESDAHIHSISFNYVYSDDSNKFRL